MPHNPGPRPTPDGRPVVDPPQHHHPHHLQTKLARVHSAVQLHPTWLSKISSGRVDYKQLGWLVRAIPRFQNWHLSTCRCHHCAAASWHSEPPRPERQPKCQRRSNVALDIHSARAKPARPIAGTPTPSPNPKQRARHGPMSIVAATRRKPVLQLYTRRTGESSRRV